MGGAPGGFKTLMSFVKYIDMIYTEGLHGTSIRGGY